VLEHGACHSERNGYRSLRTFGGVLQHRRHWRTERPGAHGFKMLGSAANIWKGAIFGSGFIGAGSSAAGNITQQLIDTGTVNGNQLLKASAAGFVGGSIGGGLGKGFSGSGNPLACTTSTPSALGMGFRQVLIGGVSGMARDAIMQVAEKGFSDFSFRQMLGAGVGGSLGSAFSFTAMRGLWSSCFTGETKPSPEHSRIQ
jgi:hypothetical protein